MDITSLRIDSITLKVSARENNLVEFKESWNLWSLPEYAKTMAAFSNNSGWSIIFWITENPRVFKWIDDKIDTVDPARITEWLNEYFAPEIGWSISTEEFLWKKIWIVTIQESKRKPVICKKTIQGKIKEWDIYYRYRWRSEIVKYPELEGIMSQIRENERLSWEKLFKDIATIWPQNVWLMDIGKGEILWMKGNIVLDKNLLKDIQFIREGKFVEKDGAPALILKWEIEWADVIFPNIGEDFRKNTKDIAKALGYIDWKWEWSSYKAQGVIWKYKVKENPLFHQEMRWLSGYSQACITYLIEQMNEKNIEDIMDEFKAFRNSR